MTSLDDLLTTYRVQRGPYDLWAVMEVGTDRIVEFYDNLTDANSAMIRFNNRICPGSAFNAPAQAQKGK